MASSSTGNRLSSDASLMLRETADELPSYHDSCMADGEAQFMLADQSKLLSRSLFATSLDTMAVVYERKYKSVLKTTAQILSKGVPIWEYKAGPSIPSISLVRLSDSTSSEPPAYAEVSGQSEIKLHSHTIQPLIYNFAYEDSTGYEWQLRWMRKEDYDDRDYSFATTAWNELVCVDCSTLRIVARIRKKLNKSKIAGHLLVSNSLMPDFQDMLLITAILVFDSFPNDGDLTHYI